MKPSDQLKVFGMQNLLLESDLARLESSGIDLGHVKTLKKDEVVDIELFDRDILQEAKKMADFYVLYYCLENTVRRLISERLIAKHGANWWQTAVSEGIRTAVADKQQKEKETVLSIRSEDPLSYTNFGELIVIMEANWDSFSDTIRSRKAMQQTLSQFNYIRNVIAHSSELSESDVTRLKLLIHDWLTIQT
jgi:HEPN superfamily Swt1-like protein